jgi:hypothetical protein
MDDPLCYVVEHGYALLGLGRSRLAAGDPAGAEVLLAARRIWTDLHAQPLVEDVDRLLAEQQRMTS